MQPKTQNIAAGYDTTTEARMIGHSNQTNIMTQKPFESANSKKKDVPQCNKEKQTTNIDICKQNYGEKN